MNLFADGRVFIVIGGDNNYGEEEVEMSFLSKWAWKKICSQFTEDYMDGTKSFIFSWDKQHRPIHEEALAFYLDANKDPKTKFVPTPSAPVVKPDPPKFYETTWFKVGVGFIGGFLIGTR